MAAYKILIGEAQEWDFAAIVFDCNSNKSLPRYR